MYTIKIVAGAEGRVPAIVEFDLTRLRSEGFIYRAVPQQNRVRLRLYRTQTLNIIYDNV